MKIRQHKDGFGIDQDGQWRQKIKGQWVAIDEPEWAKKKDRTKPVQLKMADPKKREKISEDEMVTVFRVIEKTVPDYEAEVLVRNGWEKMVRVPDSYEA